MSEEMRMFNASISVTELLTKTLENCAKDLASRCIKECAKRHGFDASEEIRFLGLENLSLIKKQMTKKSSSDRKQSKLPKKKSNIPMPFIGESVDSTICNGIVYNHGLFTQCPKKQISNGRFCKGCQTECDSSSAGTPQCGTIQERCGVGLYDFKDSKGRSPVSYVKVIEKLKLTIDQALTEAGTLNMNIPEEHFVIVDKSKPKKEKEVKRGRPKKPIGAIDADNVTDLFAKLTAEGAEEIVIEEEIESKKSKLTDEEKAAKKAALEAERASKKLDRENQLAAEKADREAKRKSDIEEKKAEREAKIAAEKAEREAKIVADKAEREAKRLQEKAERDAKKAEEKASKESTKKKPVAEKPLVKPVAEKPVAEKPVAVAVAEKPVAAPSSKVTVSRITIEGTQYLKSSSNILYNPETKEEVAIWDPESKTIKPLPDDDEEEEEEYESDTDAN